MWHLHIHQNDIWQQLTAQFNRLQPIASHPYHLKPNFCAQDTGNTLAKKALVVNHNNANLLLTLLAGC
jgi:hypothetical protein